MFSVLNYCDYDATSLAQQEHAGWKERVVSPSSIALSIVDTGIGTAP